MAKMMVFKSQLIELVVPGVAGGNKQLNFVFPDQPYLRGANISAIEVLTEDDMTVSPQQNPLITSAQMQTAYLTLYCTDVQPKGFVAPVGSPPGGVGQWIQLVPFADLHRVQNAVTAPFVRDGFQMAGQIVYWEKCQVILGAPLNNTADVSILLNVDFYGIPNSLT